MSTRLGAAYPRDPVPPPGAAVGRGRHLGGRPRRLAAGEGLSPAGRQAVTVALRVMDVLQTQLDTLHRQIRTFANQQPGCKALEAQYGVGPITNTAIWTMMGDARRFNASRQDKACAAT